MLNTTLTFRERVVDLACEIDAEYFRLHPNVRYRARRSTNKEAEDFESFLSDYSDMDLNLTVVERLAQNVHARCTFRKYSEAPGKPAKLNIEWGQDDLEALTRHAEHYDLLRSLRSLVGTRKKR